MSVDGFSARRAALEALALLLAACVLAACTVHGLAARRSHTVARSSGSATSGGARKAAGNHPNTAPIHRGDPRAAGTVLTRAIPGVSSGFRGRPALVYLPPALRGESSRSLPVLELLHGTPGSPSDWITGGRLEQTAAAFAARTNGLAPIIVMPDINGARHADSECVSSTGGNVERYLTTDVPEFVLAHYPASHDRRRWAIAGLSEGGMCATMLALRHQARYAMFGDFSGLTRPTVGRADQPSRTIAQLFAGSVDAYSRHDPLWLLARYRYGSLQGWFECGRQDGAALRAQDTVVRAARTAGITVRTSILAGRHDWAVWASALAQMLPWMWQQAAA